MSLNSSTWTPTGRTGTRTGSGTCTFPPIGGTGTFNSNTVLHNFSIYTGSNGSATQNFIQILAQSMAGGGISLTANWFNAHPATSSIPWQGSINWSYSIDVEEVVIASGFNQPSAVYSNGELTIPQQILITSLRPKTGGSWTVNCGGAVSSGTITSAMTAYVMVNNGTTTSSGHGATFTSYCTFYDGASYPSANTSVTAIIDGFNVVYPFVYNSPGSTSLYCDYRSSVYNLTVNNYSFIAPNPTYVYTPPVNYQVNAQANTITQGDPNPLKGCIYGLFTPANNVGVTPPVQLATYTMPINNITASTNVTTGWGVLATIPGWTNTYTIYAPSSQGIFGFLDITDPNTAADCCTSAPPIPATTGRENSNQFDTRMPFRLPSYTGPLLSESNRIVLDPCNSISTPGTWTGMTVVGGHLQIDTSSSTAAHVSYSPALISRQGRFLAFTLQAGTIGETIAITVNMVKGPVVYNIVTTTTTSIDYLIDLCVCPGYPGPDFQTSRYNYPFATSVEGPVWGANTISSISMSFPTTTGVYILSDISIVVKNPQTITCTQGNIPYYVTPFSHVYYMGPVVDTDGRRSLEQPAFIDIINTGKYTVQNMIASLDPGWTGSYTPSTSWYANDYVGYLGGAGCVFGGIANPTPDSWFRRNWVQTSNIPMQQFVDGVVGYPGIGDLFGGGTIGNYTQTLKLYSCKIVRATFHGIVANAVPQPLVGVQVKSTILNPGTIITGTSISDSIGTYALGSAGSITYGVFVPTVKLEQIVCGSASVQNTTSTNPGVNQRQDLRVCFKGAPILNERPNILQDKLGRYHLAYIESNDILYNFASDTTSDNGWTYQNLVTSYGDVQDVKMDIDPNLQRIWLVFTRKNSSTGIYSVWYSYSDDEGQTFVNGIEIMSNALGISIGCFDDSSIIKTWFEYASGTSGPGTQYAQFSPGSGQPFGSIFQLSDSTSTPIPVADQGWCNIQQARDYRNALCWSPITTSSTTPVLYISTDNGKTWMLG